MKYLKALWASSVSPCVFSFIYAISVRQTASIKKDKEQKIMDVYLVLTLLILHNLIYSFFAYSFLYLGETFSPMQLTGALVTIVAIYMVNYKSIVEWGNAEEYTLSMRRMPCLKARPQYCCVWHVSREPNRCEMLTSPCWRLHILCIEFQLTDWRKRLKLWNRTINLTLAFMGIDLARERCVYMCLCIKERIKKNNIYLRKKYQALVLNL